MSAERPENVPFILTDSLEHVAYVPAVPASGEERPGPSDPIPFVALEDLP